MKKVYVKNAKIRILTNYLPHFGKYVPGSLNSSILPIPVIIVDKDTQDEFPAQLISVLPMKESIPEILAYLSEGASPQQCTQDVLTRCNANSVNQIALYLYERRS